MANSDQAELVFLPLGGVGEIGMNLALYGYGPARKREWVVVDMGVSFAGPDLPGADLILPDIRFLQAERNNVRGIVITHAHEDHYGALLDLWPLLNVPVYATPFTAGLLEAKRHSEPGAPDIPVTIYRAGETFDVGPFEFEALAVTHSIPEPVSLAIKTPLGTVIHTGDWKMDPEPSIGPLINEARFRALGDEGVLALMCDSTNALRDGESPSEQEVGESLRQIIENARGRVAVTSFSSNVGRIRSIALAARDAGRQTLVLGRSMKRMIDVAAELGYLDGVPEFLSEDDYGYIPRENIVIILTGSQGEPRAALAKLARDEMRSVALSPGDTVIYSSRAIPGNEKAINDTKNLLIEQGVQIISDGEQLVHVSGHPRRNELKRMYEWVRPRILVPVHGEAAHLVGQGSLAAMAGIPEVPQVRNGDILRLAPGRAEIIGEAPFGRLIKDGRLIGDEEEVGIVDRRKLSYVGHVAVSFILDAKYNILEDPEIVPFGIPEVDDEGELLEDLFYDAAVEALQSIPREKRRDLAMVREAIRRAIRSASNEAWGKKAGRYRIRDKGLKQTMLGRLNHVAIAVPDMAAASAVYRNILGAKLTEPQRLPEHGVTVVFIDVGNTKIELLEPLSPESPISAFLVKNPTGGIHHICYEVPDIMKARDRLMEQGARILGDGEPKLGAHGKPVLFLHPKDFNGTLIELEQE